MSWSEGWHHYKSPHSFIPLTNVKVRATAYVKRLLVGAFWSVADRNRLKSSLILVLDGITFYDNCYLV